MNHKISKKEEIVSRKDSLRQKVVRNELAELVIVCGKCGRAIILAGFQQG
jgi:hypothetical protein